MGQMSATDFEEWRAWFELEPRGDDRADYHTAFLCHLFASSKMTDPPSVADFLKQIRALWGDVEKIDPRAEIKRRQKKMHARMRAAGEEYKAMGIQGNGKHRDVIGTNKP